MSKTKSSLIAVVFLTVVQLAAAEKVTFGDLYAFGNSLDAQGNTTTVWVLRETLENNVGVSITTLMAYSLCPAATPNQCEEGFGAIPNADFTGQLNLGVGQLANLNLLVDTSQIPYYSNYLCLEPGDGYCFGGTLPTSGGVVSVTFGKTVNYAYVDNPQLERDYQNGILVVTGSAQGALYSCSAVGTVLGLAGQSVGCGLEFSSFVVNYIPSATASAKQLESSRHQQLESWLVSQPQGEKTIAWLKRVGMLP